MKKHDTKNPIKKINNSKKYRSSNYTKLKEKIKAKFKKTLNVKNYTRINKVQNYYLTQFSTLKIWIKYISMDINTVSNN